MASINSPIIKEIPVFISQGLRNKLHVHEYWLDDSMRADDAAVVECSMKDNHEVILNLERNTTSRNFSHTRAEQMAINADGNKQDNELNYPRKIMDRQVYASKLATGKNTAVGILQDGELHLTHVAHCLLLRPAYLHLDMSDKRATSDDKDKGEGDVTEEEEEELQQVTVKFSRQETERAKKAREKSYTYLKKQTAKQVWRKVDYFDNTSVRSELEVGKLFCQDVSTKVCDNAPTGTAKLDALVAEELLMGENKTRSYHGEGLMTLKGTIIDRIKAILISARLVDMATLNRLLGETTSANELQDRIKVVQHVAVLVQGCWVVQSDIVISKDSISHGLPFGLARAARDYMLYQFTKSRTVRRSQLLEVIKAPGDVVKTMLEELAVRNGTEWQFKLATDVQFTISYREVEQRQMAKWELRLEQILAGLKPVEPGALTPTRSRRRSGRDSISSDTEGSSRNHQAPKQRRTARVSETRPPDNVTIG